MKKRPLIITILAVIHLIEPLLKIGYLKFETGFEWTVILDNIFSINSPKAFLEFWFLYPIAGVALFFVRQWTYALFVGVQAYSIFAHLTYQKFTWPYVAETPFISHSLLLVFNLLVIAYVLMPEVRKLFFNPAIRWWETPTRYYYELPCSVTFGDSNDLVDINILNISKTGCFIKYPGEVVDGQPLSLHLTYGTNDITIDAEVVRITEFQGNQGIGVKFHFQNIWQHFTMNNILGDIYRNETTDQQEDIDTQAAA